MFKLIDLYGCITTCQLGDGSSILLWRDNWVGDSLMDLFPAIAHFAKHLDIFVKQVAEASSLEDLFHIPISQQVARELQDIRNLIQDFEFSEEVD